MRFKYIVFVAAPMIATVFVLAALNDWLRFFFHCESFGCAGFGLLYLLIGTLIVASFFLSGLLFGPAPRLSSGLFAGGIATLTMILSFGVLFMHNQFKIAQDWKEYEKVCAQHPELCPSKSAP
jgi:hypothetical protein